MHQLEFLKDLVVVLAVAVVVVGVLRRVGIPTIAGFILAGVLTGPAALGLIDGTKEVAALAEIGVVLLLFGIGLELSLDRIRRRWQTVLLGGALQVGATLALAALTGWLFGLEPGAALFVGCVVAISSTAVVLRALAKRGELETPHGRFAVGLLVFQDLSVVPMILAVPFLAGRGGTAFEAVNTLGLAVAVLIGTLVAARIVVPRLLKLVAETRERELFVLTVFLVCFGTAWLVSSVGVSLALGAFLAGLVVASSEYRHQALGELIPARELLASLFFVSVGMLLDPLAVADRFGAVLALVAAILVGKFAIVTVVALVLRLPIRSAVLAGAALCQVGEFAFVLFGAASSYELVSATVSNDLLVATVLSMLSTPLLLAVSPRVASVVAAVAGARHDPVDVSGGTPATEGHVIVVGYGLCGRSVCEALREADTPHVVVDVDVRNVREANRNGSRAILGDVTQPELLHAIGVRDARLVVLSINDVRGTELATKIIRQTAPDVDVVVRAHYEVDRPVLMQAGASRIVTSEFAATKAILEDTRLVLAAS